MDIAENIVAKGEIAHNEQFVLLSQCFLKSTAADASETVCMRGRVTTLIYVKNDNKSTITLGLPLVLLEMDLLKSSVSRKG